MNNTKQPQQFLSGTAQRDKQQIVRRVLVPLNGNYRSEAILPYVAIMARWFQAEVELFHVIATHENTNITNQRQVVYSSTLLDRSTNLASSYMQEVAVRLEPHAPKVRWGIATGSPAVMIATRAVAHESNVIALVSHQPSPWQRVFKPSMINELWHLSPVPLLVVKSELLGSDASLELPSTLIVPMRTPRDGDIVASFLESIAAKARIKMVVVLSDRAQGGSQTTHSNTPAALAELESSHNVTMHFTKNILEDVLNMQQEMPSPWIITAERPRNRLTRAIYGSLSHRIIESATCPVVVAPEVQQAKRNLEQAKELAFRAYGNSFVGTDLPKL